MLEQPLQAGWNVGTLHIFSSPSRHRGMTLFPLQVAYISEHALLLHSSEKYMSRNKSYAPRFVVSVKCVLCAKADPAQVCPLGAY